MKDFKIMKRPSLIFLTLLFTFIYYFYFVSNINPYHSIVKNCTTPDGNKATIFFFNFIHYTFIFSDISPYIFKYSNNFLSYFFPFYSITNFYFYPFFIIFFTHFYHLLIFLKLVLYLVKTTTRLEIFPKIISA